MKKMPDMFKDPDAWGKWFIDTSMNAVLSCLPGPDPERVKRNRSELRKLRLEITELEKQIAAL